MYRRKLRICTQIETDIPAVRQTLQAQIIETPEKRSGRSSASSTRTSDSGVCLYERILPCSDSRQSPALAILEDGSSIGAAPLSGAVVRDHNPSFLAQSYHPKTSQQADYMI